MGFVHFAKRTVAGLALLTFACMPVKATDEPENHDKAFKFTAAADTLGSFSANHPDSGLNQIRNFDTKADAFSLTALAFGMEWEGKRFNFHVDAGYGEGPKTMIATDPWRGPNQYIQQAFVGWKPFREKEIKLEAGKFATPVGGEVAETYNDYNVTRSPLFVLGIPYYHFGVRMVVPITKTFTATGYLVNGWSNTVDNNAGKTLGAAVAWTGKKNSIAAVWFGGPEQNNTNASKRNMVDVVYNYTAHSRWNNYTEVNWGKEDSSIWYGFAHASRFKIARDWSVTPRVSWFMDRNGLTSGMPQRLIEMTATVEYRLGKYVIARGELRRDLSNRNYFDQKDQPGSSKTQDSAVVGLIVLWRGAM